MILGLEFENDLPEPVRKEFEQLVAALQVFSASASPSNAEYVVGRAHADLSAERVVADSSTIRWDLTSNQQIRAHVIGAASSGPGVLAFAANTQATRDRERLQARASFPPGGAAAIPTNTLYAGTYTPTLTNVANLDASTAYACQYLRVGQVVTVSGKVDVDPTAGAATQLGISLPLASNFGNAQECGGAAFASGIAGQGAAIRADATNDRAEMVWVAVDLTNQPMYFSFTYQMI